MILNTEEIPYYLIKLNDIEIEPKEIEYKKLFNGSISVLLSLHRKEDRILINSIPINQSFNIDIYVVDEQELLRCDSYKVMNKNMSNKFSIKYSLFVIDHKIVYNFKNQQELIDTIMVKSIRRNESKN